MAITDYEAQETKMRGIFLGVSMGIPIGRVLAWPFLIFWQVVLGREHTRAHFGSPNFRS